MLYFNTNCGRYPDPEEQQALERLTSWMGAHMRSIRLPDLLIEVDNELDWSRHFIPPSRRAAHRDLDLGDSHSAPLPHNPRGPRGSRKVAGPAAAP